MTDRSRYFALTERSLALIAFFLLQTVSRSDAVEPASAAKPTVTDGHLDQNWRSGFEVGQINWFHHASQGARILPYDWFMSLEQPTTDPAMPEMGLFSDPVYLRSFGFLRSVTDDEYNPGNLPIGFAISKNWVDPNEPSSRPTTALGLTCAACHTSEVFYQGTRLRIDGGSAMINLGSFQQSLAMALLIANSSAEKFDAFAKRWIKYQPIPKELTGKKRAELEAKAKALLKKELEKAVTRSLKKQKRDADLNIRTVDGGFGRTDAFALIGNRVFGLLGSVNLAQTNAPVNYPHLWDTPWFYRVQYNGSIRLPMVRNIGEALGLGAKVNSKFESTVDIEHLHQMEDQIAGSQPFTGLKAPAWPAQLFGEIKGFQERNGKWKRGKTLYEKHCMHCHYRIDDIESALSLDREHKRFKKHWTQPNRFGRSFMKLPAINFVDIGTDPLTVTEFYRRIVYTGSVTSDQSMVPAVEALTVATSEVRKRAYEALNLSAADYAAYDGYRELSGDPAASLKLEYKARPLNGVWATAPFLHNGSVANLYELLLPADQRMSTFYLGSTEFDPQRVGFKTDPAPGFFRMNTMLAGNHNTGHEFRDLTPEEEANLTEFQRQMLAENGSWAVNGVLGPELTDSERWALIEYVKSLGSQRTKKPANLETPPPGEPTLIAKLAGALAAEQQQTEVGRAHRGQHPKSHGAVWARFRVADDLPSRLRVGLFDQPNDYNSVIRFSNGKEQDDQKPDVHGMAIKVFVADKSETSPAVTQDFVLADNPVFFAKNVQHLLEFFTQMKAAAGDRKKIVEIAQDSFPALAGFSKPLTTSPLQATYWSQTPYRFGDTAVKYMVVPRDDYRRPYTPAVDPKNRLREAMVDRLTRRKLPASFDFYIQEYVDENATPIEDATHEWKSNWVKLATIDIYPQKFDSSEQMIFCENIPFTPWAGLPEHQPLGGINRARKPIYDQSRELRHRTNAVEAFEVTGNESF